MKRLLSFLLLSSCASQPVGPADRADDRSRFDAYVLGRTQDGGLPHVGCEKPCCTEARSRGQVETPACIGIHDRETDRLVLIEATPGIDTHFMRPTETSSNTAIREMKV